MVDTIKILGSLLGSGALSQGSGGTVLGNILGAALGGNSQQQSSGLSNILGGLLGSTQQQNSGGLSSLLEGLMGGNTQQHNYEQLRNQATQSGALDQAEILIRAMINAAKSDGRVDEAEQKKILGRLGDITPDEIDFVKRELAAPLDVNEFIRSVPSGFEQQVYIMSLMAIDLDTNHEAQYLHQLVQGMNLTPEICNQIHEKLGAQKLYG